MGALAACTPAVMLGERFGTLPIRGIRWAVAGLFLIVGFYAAVSALQLV